MSLIRKPVKTLVSEVFGVGVNSNTPAYVDRGTLDRVFKEALEANQHITIHGGSKQGKTWLRERALKPEQSVVVQCTTTSTASSLLEQGLADIGVTAKLTKTGTGSLEGEVNLFHEGAIGLPKVAQAKMSGENTIRVGQETVLVEQFLGQTVANLKWVANAFLLSDKRLVIEDFHYMSEAEQDIFASWMKALGEYGLYLVIIGVWSQSHLLTYFNGDLDGRVTDIQLEWSNEELEEVIQNGLLALKVVFSDSLRREIVHDSYGNVGQLHRIMKSLCEILQVDELSYVEEFCLNLTHEEDCIDASRSLDRAREQVADQMRSRFETFASNFVRGMRRMSEGLVVYKHLLQAVTAASDDKLMSRGVDSKDLLSMIDAEGIRSSDLTQALERIGKLQSKIRISPPVLAYHRSGKRIQLLDRSFLFFRKYGSPSWPWENETTEGEIVNDLAETDPLEF